MIPLHVIHWGDALSCLHRAAPECFQVLPYQINLEVDMVHLICQGGLAGSGHLHQHSKVGRGHHSWVHLLHLNCHAACGNGGGLFFHFRQIHGAAGLARKAHTLRFSHSQQCPTMKECQAKAVGSYLHWPHHRIKKPGDGVSQSNICSQPSWTCPRW